MAPITVKLPDDTELELAEGATGADAAAAIGPRLAKDALAVRVNGEVRDLAAPLDDGERIEIVTPGRPDALDVLRHDTAHVLATAVLDLWPGTKVSIGRQIGNAVPVELGRAIGTALLDALHIVAASPRS